MIVIFVFWQRDASGSVVAARSGIGGEGSVRTLAKVREAGLPSRADADLLLGAKASP